MKIEEIKIGAEYTLSQLWDGEFGEAEDILKTGTVSPDEETIIAFEVVEQAESPIDTIVRVTDIY